MTHLSYEYRAERFATPPTADALNELARDGWKLVSVTLDMVSPKPVSPKSASPEAATPEAATPEAAQSHYIAYLERPGSIGASRASGRSEENAEFEWRPGRVAANGRTTAVAVGRRASR